MTKKADKEVPYNLAPLMAGLESGEIKYVEPEDTFKFDCVACGGCCMNKDVMVNPHDIWMMFESGVAQTLGFNKTADLFSDVHAPLHLTLGGNSGAPVCIIEFRPVSEPKEGEPPPLTICPFAAPVLELKDVDGAREKMKKFAEADFEDPKEAYEVLQELASTKTTETGMPQFLCALHKAKPTICRAYPIGRAGVKTQEDKTLPFDMKYIQVPLTCGEAKTEWTVQGWVDKWDLVERYKGSDAHYAVAGFIAQNKDKLPEEVRWAAANILFNFDMWGARDIEGMTFDGVVRKTMNFLEDFLEQANKAGADNSV